MVAPKVYTKNFWGHFNFTNLPTPSEIAKLFTHY